MKNSLRGNVAATFAMMVVVPFLISAGAILMSAAALANGDAPVSPGGRAGAAPAAEATAMIAPSLGTGSTSAAEIIASGAVQTPTTVKSGLDSVAYGAFGKPLESIINWDSRTRAHTTSYPNRAIVLLTYNGAHLCTGWLYGTNMVATAGHCVHTGGSSGSWRNPALYRVYPGKDGTASPYGSCGVTRLSSVTGWTQSKDFHYDYGALRLNCTIGNTVGWFGMYNNTAPNNTPAIIGGYPGDKPLTQWTSADKIRASSTTMLAYRMDTVGGHSGSPIWHDRDEALATTGAWGIGVHNYGVGAFGTNMNSAARLTSARITNYVNWRNAK